MAEDYSYLKNWGIKMLKIMLESSLEEKNVEDFEAAVREFDRRDRRHVTMQIVEKYLEKESLDSGSDFASVLAKFVMGVRIEVQ